MNEYERLLAFMQIAYHNMGTLHRHLVDDPGWFENHEEIDEWAEAIAEQVDDLTETGIALGYKAPNIKDAVLMFGSDVLTGEPRKMRETFTKAAEIIRSIAGMMQTAEAMIPASVANKLQEYEYYWSKEANYKIAHALGMDFRRGGVERPMISTEDDD